MKIRALVETFTVCKLKKPPEISELRGVYFFAKTKDEFSLVAESDKLPPYVTVKEDGWRCMKIEAKLDFSLVGILAGITSALAENSLPVFAVSTYDTDYILVKSEHFEKAVTVLKSSGYDVEA